LRGWIPTALVAAGIVVIVFLVIAFNNSWWVEAKPVASSSQQAPDGMSLFTPAGQDYSLRTGLVLIRIRDDAETAAVLGLPEKGTKVVQFDVPVEVRVLAPSGALDVDLVDSLSITTDKGDVISVTLVYDGNGNYGDSIAYLNHLADNVGWTAADFDQLTKDLTAAQTASKSDTYSATLQPRNDLGIAVSAALTIGLNATFSIGASRLP
jgi:hypothetical protein